MFKSFASDNYSGAHPEVLQALIDANTGHARAYGYDEITARAEQRFRDLFGDGIDVFFVFSGTGANVLALKASTRPYHAVLCAQSAHIHTDETGAPEAVAGCKLLAIPSADGKLTADALRPYLGVLGDEHAAQPRLVSITQPTELGALYSVDEIAAIAAFARQNGLLLHMDGARLANAAVALDLPPRAFTRDAGVDVLSFGGTKNGLLCGEAVVFFNRALAADFKYIRKQGLQLASKMRFISAQFDALLAGDLWKRSAAQANRAAARLAAALQVIPQVTVTRPVQTNAVFAIIPPQAIAPLQAAYPFYVWNAQTGECRWMASFDTTDEDVDGFVACLREILEG